MSAPVAAVSCREPARDPGGLLDLPPGFRYRVISEQGSRMSNAAPVPGDFDGMAAFRGGAGQTLLVRNHELDGSPREAVPAGRPYNRGAPGGTTALIVDGDRRAAREYVASSGTLNNCAGGATPWGTWITCEEDRVGAHGYAFEVDPAEPEGGLSRTPIRAMGRFAHEAVGVDPRTGIVYLTEDDARGEPYPGERRHNAFLYRYLPDDRRQRPGALQRGGRLQALALEPPDERVKGLRGGGASAIVWRDVDPDQPHEDALAGGCARFRRLEGCHFSGGALWFADTSGGQDERGQLFRYLPGSDRLELFLEGTPSNHMKSPDNVVVAPFGDLWFCTEERRQVMGVTPEAKLYTFARCALPDAELAGPTFSPDSRTFFVNVQEPGLTFAVWGPFEQLPGPAAALRARAGPDHVARRRQLAHAPPPASLRPRLSDDLVESVARRGLSELEGAALARLGTPLA